MYKIDATNRKILTLLQDDGSITNADLARRVGLSPASTLERVKKLESSGVISGYVALVNPDKIGKQILALVEINLSDHSADAIGAFQEAVDIIPEILESHLVAGTKDFILKIITDDIKSYERLALEKISVLPYLGRVSTTFVLSTRKSQTKIPI
jgi:Lrp/AsnC family leucine-responsive transcriptional regulator